MSENGLADVMLERPVECVLVVIGRRCGSEGF
jgi:hypothetical protein